MYEDNHRARERGPSPPRNNLELSYDDDDSYAPEDTRRRERDWDRDRNWDRETAEYRARDYDRYYHGPPREAHEPRPRSGDQGGGRDDYMDRRDEDAALLHPHDGDDRGSRRYDRGGRGYSRPYYDDGTRRDDARRGPDEDLRHFSASPGGSPDRHPRRDRSTSPLRQAGTPSDTVILEGLPSDVSLETVRDCLFKQSDLSHYPSVDLRIPSTGRGKPPIPQPSHMHLLTSSSGKRRAFAQFENVEQAVEFVKGNYPKLVINFFSGEVDDSTDGMTLIYIHYARNRDDAERESRAGTAANWSCPTCDFSNYATRSRCKNCGGPPTDPSQYRFLLTGESDASDTPSQILVFFPLAPSVNEDVFSAGAGKLELVQKQAAARNSGDGPKLKSTAPTGDASGYGARPGSLHRTFLMRDQETNESFNFGFAEFWTVEDAMAAMKKFQMMREFTIASKPVTVSTIHLGVFVPELREVTRFNERVSFNPLFNPAIRVKYWEPHVYPSQRVITEVPPGGTSGDGSKGDAADEAKKGKKRKADGNLPASSTKKSVPMAGQMAFWQKRHVEIHEGKRAADAVGENGQSEERAPVKISLSGANAISTGPIKISLTGASLPKAPAPTASPNGAPNIEDSQTPAPQMGNAAPDKTYTPEASVSYVDREKICCLICMMKYKSLDDLNTHEKSRNHKNATADEEKVKAAKPRLTARDKRMAKQAEEQPAAPAADEESAPQYRDRAKERREVFNQPAKPKVPVQGGNKPVRKDEKTANPPAAAAAASKEKTPPPAPSKSKGAGMLAKMGWSTGQGLGANGDGRTEVIATHAYQEGVGLGAEGGNLGDAAELAQRKTTNSYAEYVNTVQDRARERYNKMG
ncbi:RNA-binding protein [Colletotrichum scovillei]|uniref:RNA-binding protein n=1 Tax=Colletotrichum scovillei TaxID=1209932 RepID=A0A9P7UCL0_9PEZI|nr:RNA-binding protein [Colletotrichum scovillei]KAG7056765.1 RNA-binding protein [Colletotrichum scovillei]KAG7066661.1 RNA-binding protein [Colletotrichum scovillei]